MAPQPRPGMGGPTATPQPATGGFWRSLGGGVAGGLIGGMLGNMLFGGASQSGHAAGGAPAAGGCSSIGLFDILLIVGIVWLGMKFLRRRKENTYAYESASGPAVQPSWQPTPEPEPTPLLVDQVQAELNQIRAYDSQFNEAAFKEMAQDVFFKLQAAWMRQDLTQVKSLLTEEMYGILQQDLEGMKSKGQVNRLENIAIREIAFSEAWQEEGKDYITVGYLANLLDYTVDAKTNQVVSGSDTEPVKFEEYWTFVRLVGGGSPWQLGAIQQAG
jgi:predicted lipid-binding transport protein (Tim44 family)